MTALVAKARQLACEAHANQRRKAGNVPYIQHLEAVAQSLEAHGIDDEVILASAYLHDLLEDQPKHASQLHTTMPSEVVETVQVLTEQKHDAQGKLRPKSDRFSDYLKALDGETPAARRAAPISCADKIDNTRSIVETARQGEPLWMKLRTRPGQLRRQLQQLRLRYDGRIDPSLLETFDQAASELDQAIEAWLPGRAVHIAAEAHLGQFDKAQKPYIDHPLRLMAAAEGTDARMVAVLHDVVEDSDWTLDRLQDEGFGEKVVRALDHLTRRGGESYDDFIERVAGDRLATRVKLLDLKDNSDLSRIAAPTPRDHQRVAKYRAASSRLNREQETRSLWVVLDEPSRARLLALAAHPVQRATHVTLAHRVLPRDFDPSWVPGAASVGDEVEVRTVANVVGKRVQAMLVEIAGMRRRPVDDGLLHITLSREPGARSRDANQLLAEQQSGDPHVLVLRGRVTWVE